MDKQNKTPTVNGVKWKLDNVNKYNKQFAENWDVGILFSSFNGYLEAEECENNAKEVMKFLEIKKYRIKY